MPLLGRKLYHKTPVGSQEQPKELPVESQGWKTIYPNPNGMDAVQESSYYGLDTKDSVIV